MTLPAKAKQGESVTAGLDSCRTDIRPLPTANRAVARLDGVRVLLFANATD